MPMFIPKKLALPQRSIDHLFKQLQNTMREIEAQGFIVGVYMNTARDGLHFKPMKTPSLTLRTKQQ